MIGSLILRNIRIFFRDRASVFFSLLASLMMFLLYILFLGSVQVESVQDKFPFASREEVEGFINSWVFAGILTLTPITTSLGAMQIFVADQAASRFKDFSVSPVARWKIIMGYLGAAFIISFSMSLLVFGLSELYLVATGVEWLSTGDVLRTVGLLALFCLVFSGFASLIASLVKSDSAYSSVSIVTGTTAGFITGIYVPIGVLPAAVQDAISALPFFHAAALLREPFAGQALAEVAQGHAAAIASIKDTFGFSVQIGNVTLSTAVLIGILIGFCVLSVILATARISRKL
ncbi:MAG TPA: ABC transporter permease [Verrucomicrobiae bacterium]|nr:ABC transporter permease [Verrucomicrobiae bacterium]